MSTVIPSSNVLPFRQPSQGERFVILRHSLLASTNYQSLTPPQVSLLIEFYRRFNGFNNGDIRISIDEAKTVLHSGQAVASRAFEALEVHGFTRRLQQGTFDFPSKADRDSKWELTELALGTQMDTNDSKTGTNSGGLVPVASTNIKNRLKSIDIESDEGENLQGPIGPTATPSLPSPSTPTPSSARPPPPEESPRGNGGCAMEDDWRNFGRPSRMATELPENWRPLRDLTEFEESRLADLKLWAKATGKTMVDWNSYFELWLKKTPPGRSRNGQGNGRAGSVLAAADKLIERFEQQGATDDYVPGSSGPQPLALDKPPSADGVRKLPPR